MPSTEAIKWSLIKNDYSSSRTRAIWSAHTVPHCSVQEGCPQRAKLGLGCILILVFISLTFNCRNMQPAISSTEQRCHFSFYHLVLTGLLKCYVSWKKDAFWWLKLKKEKKTFSRCYMPAVVSKLSPIRAVKLLLICCKHCFTVLDHNICHRIHWHVSAKSPEKHYLNNSQLAFISNRELETDTWQFMSC